MKTLTLDGIEYELVPKVKREEYEYPMWFSHNNLSGLLVKFTSLSDGIVVFGHTPWGVGSLHSNWSKHTNSSVWTQVEDPSKLQDKDLVVVWDYEDSYSRKLAFYDATNNRSYQMGGFRKGCSWDNYEKLNISELPESLKSWALKAQKTLEN